MKCFVFVLASLLLAVRGAQQAFPFSSFVKSPFISNAPNDTLRVKYVPSSTGTPVIYANKPVPQQYSQQITLEYNVKFEKGFEWVLGGKLPGITSNNKKAVGCIQPHPVDGWSYRIMWRNDARVELYIYDQSRVGGGIRCGLTKGPRNGILTTDKWFNFKMYMRMNSDASKSDGLAKLYIDDKLTIQRSDIKFKGVNSANISNIMFTTFYGGHSPTWSPSKTTYAQIKGARIYNYDVAV